MRQRKINSTIVCGALFLIIAVLLLTVVYPNQIIIKGRETVSSAFFPKLCAYALIILSVWFLIDGILQTVKPGEASESTDDQLAKKDSGSLKISPIVWTIGICLACIGAIQLLGFVITCFAFLALSFKKGGMPTWWKPLLVSALITAVLYLIFRTLMLIILPKGALVSWVLNLIRS